jgi:hypothetical protein
MPIIWLLEWQGITPVQYEEIKRRVNWEEEVPDGLYFHCAAFNEKGLVLTEVWESPDHVQPFMDDRLLPVIKRMGITRMPRVDLYETYKIFAPGYEAEPG